MLLLIAVFFMRCTTGADAGDAVVVVRTRDDLTLVVERES